MTRRGNTATNGAGYAPVSLGTGVRANARTPPMYMEGTDRLGSIAWTAALPTGSVLFDLAVHPGIFKSLRDAAKTRQYIQWHHLEFKFACATNTQKDGSYVAAFVADPEDVLNEDPVLAVEEVAGAPGMVQDSIWRTRTVTVNRGGGNSTSNAIVDPTKFGHYTSESGEPRFYSPGVIRALVDGEVGQAGAMVLYCTYRCTLHVQARQTDSEVTPDAFLRNAIAAFGTDGRTYLTKTDGSNLVWSDFFPNHVAPDVPSVFLTTGTLIGGTDGDPTASVTTNYLKFVPVRANPALPGGAFALSSGPFDNDAAVEFTFSSPNTTTQDQLFGANHTFTLVVEDEENERRYRVRALPHGGLTNTRQHTHVRRKATPVLGY